MHTQLRSATLPPPPSPNPPATPRPLSLLSTIHIISRRVSDLCLTSANQLPEPKSSSPSTTRPTLTPRPITHGMQPTTTATATRTAKTCFAGRGGAGVAKSASPWCHILQSQGKGSGGSEEGVGGGGRKQGSCGGDTGREIRL